MENFSMVEETFDISKSERLSYVTGSSGPSNVRKFENQTGAKIRIIERDGITTLKIAGNSSQREEAKVTIRDALETTSFIPTISYFILTKSGVDNNNLKFVKFNEEIVPDSSNESNEKSRYFVEFLPENHRLDGIDEITNRLEDYIQITPRQFNTFDKIDDCLDRLSLKLQANSKQKLKTPLFSEKIILKPRIFLGKVLFSEINSPEDTFSIHEWYNFSILSGRGRRGSANYDNEKNYSIGKNVNVEFQQDSHHVYERFKTLQRRFGFKWDDKQIVKDEDKGQVYIYYTPSTNKKRKLKLRWDEEENKWKIVGHSYGLNRLANIDIISGSKAPDFRLSLKTHYDLPSEGSKVEDVINNIQNSPTFVERDGMWFRSRDFDDTLIKRATVRQVIEKKRFRNDNFLITFTTIKHDSNDNVSTQNLITLKHHTWNQKIELSDSEGFMNNVIDTILYVQDMMGVIF